MGNDKRYRSNEQRDHANRVSKLIILLYSHFVLCNGKPVTRNRRCALQLPWTKTPTHRNLTMTYTSVFHYLSPALFTTLKMARKWLRVKITLDHKSNTLSFLIRRSFMHLSRQEIYSCSRFSS